MRRYNPRLEVRNNVCTGYSSQPLPLLAEQGSRTGLFTRLTIHPPEGVFVCVCVSKMLMLQSISVVTYFTAPNK